MVQEYKVNENQNLLSRTNSKGIITYAADAFVEVSGYSREELVGSPHSIIRHPDMPKEAFNDLWQTIKRGENWVGLVKNRRKNGQFYWVRAHVSPIMEKGTVQGYTSVRIKPTEEEIKLAEECYARLRAGNSRGFRLVSGQIKQSGWRYFFANLNYARLQARVYLALLINSILLVLATYNMYASQALINSPLERLANISAESKELVAEVSQVLINSEYICTGILFLVALIGTVSFLLLFASVRQEVKGATRFALQIAAGNLATDKPRVSSQEFSALTAMQQVMQRSLINISLEIRRSLAAVRPISSKLTESSSVLAFRTERQCSALQDAANNMERMIDTVLKNADNAAQANNLATSAAHEVHQSGEAVNTVVARMAAITHSSTRIAEIVDVIDGIAFQTNILALNASIEAARAGQQGRGFAIVAQEVRNLATRSANAAAEVRTLVESCCHEITQGNAQVNRAQHAIAELVGLVQKVSNIMGEIASSSEEQRYGIEQINFAVIQLHESTQSNSTLAVDSSTVAHLLEEQVKALESSIEVLRFGETEALPSQSVMASVEKMAVDVDAVQEAVLVFDKTPRPLSAGRRSSAARSIEPSSIELFG